MTTNKEFDALKQKIAAVNPKVLQEFVLDLYLQYPELTERIASLALANDPVALKKSIAKRITSVKRGRKFIHYRASRKFATELGSILRDIEKGLLGEAPLLAFELVDSFLTTVPGVMNRADDSWGEIGNVYKEAVLLWLKAAGSCQGSDTDWMERVVQLNEQNDYGVLDPLLPNSHLLLTEKQLQQLAWRYESEARKAEKEDSESFEVIKRTVALGEVAKALQDPQLYERSVRIHSPQPNDLQKEGIVEAYIEYGRLDKALEWLNTEWDARFEGMRQGLLEKLYEKKGDTGQLCEIRWQQYQRTQRYDAFMQYLETLDEKAREEACQQALAQARKGEKLYENVIMLLMLGDSEYAEKLLLSQYRKLDQLFYGDLLTLSKQFENEGFELAVVACHRALLTDILDRGRSKSYSHAAKYFKKLQTLDNRINDYAPLQNHEEFVALVEEKHYRKRSFWNRVR